MPIAKRNVRVGLLLDDVDAFDKLANVVQLRQEAPNRSSAQHII
jgi:hypothetical protein